MPPSTAFSPGAGGTPADDADEHLAVRKRALLDLHAELARHRAGSTEHDAALAAVLAATRDLLSYEAAVPAARAAQQRRALRPRILRIAGGLAATAALVLGLAAAGVTGTAAAIAAIGALVTAAVLAAGTSERLLGPDTVQPRYAITAASVAVGVMLVAPFWWPAVVIVALAIGISAQPWAPETSPAAGGVRD